MGVYFCNPSALQMEGAGSQVQGQPGLHTEFKANPSYIVRPCFQKQNKAGKSSSSSKSA
jgi:hypothetical protein